MLSFPISGTYSTAASQSCTSCPAGQFCADPASLPVNCPAGTFSTGGAAVCTLCPAGWKCPDATGVMSAVCLEGTYSAGNQTDCTDCPAGFACPYTDSDEMLTCVAGTYSPGNQIYCSICPAGSECPDPAAVSVSTLMGTLNSLWPSDAIWWHRSGSTLAQVMACCLTAPSHYLNQCWLIMNGVLWHSPKTNFTGSAHDNNS